MERRLYMRKFLVVTLCVFTIIRNAEAFLLPPMPWSISFDGVADASGGVEGGGNVAVSGMEKAQQKVTEVLDKIKKTKADIESKINDVKDDFEEKIADFKDKASNFIGEKVNNITGALHSKKEGDSAIATSREIKECQVADISSEESIVEAFDVLFGQYPADILRKYPQDQESVKKAYTDKAVELSQDAMIELYITARDMNERMEVLQKEVDGMSDKYVLGTTVEATPEISGETGEANDELGSWVNYYKVVNIYDSILRITEELSALDAQYEAAQALRKGITPKEAIVDKEASLNGFFEFGITSSSSYAQQGGGLASLFKKIDLSNIKKAAGNIVSVKSRTAQSAFKGTADQFEDLRATNAIAFTLNEATTLHNLIQQLDNFKETFVEYNRMKTLHKEVIQRLKNSEDCVVAHLGRYYNDPYSAWLGKGCTYTDDLGIFCDENIKVTKENLRNITEGDHLCKSDKTKICSKFDLNRYERRGGLSGWLLSAYQVAKAAKTLDVTTDDLSPQVNDVEISGVPEVSNLEDMEEVEANGIAASEQGLNDASLSPSEEEKMLENDRERDVLAWHLGAITAKKLGAEMSSNGSSVYGLLKNKYPLWNDEKYFYDKYLEGKYSNMEVFIKSVDLRDVVLHIAEKINDSLYVVEDEEEKQQEGYEGPKMLDVLFEEVLEYNKIGFEALKNKVSEISAPQINNLERLQNSWDARFRQTNEELEKTLETQGKLIESIYTQLDEKNVSLNEAKKRHNAAKEEKANIESNIKAEKIMLETSAARSAKSSHVDAKTFEQSAEKNIEESKKAVDVSIKNAEAALVDIDALRDQTDTLKERLNTYNNVIEKIKEDHIKKVAQLQYQKELALTTEYGNIQKITAPDLVSLLNDATDTKGIIFNNIINLANRVEEIVRNNALEAIKDGYEEIVALGDDRFDVTKYSIIEKIHTNVMNRIKNPPVDLDDVLGVLTGYVDLEPIEKLVADMMAQSLFNHICPDNNCYKSDTQYYVALTPNGKDFTIPKTITPSYTPPLREIVHFDGVDFDNLNISKDLVMEKSAFINQSKGNISDAEGTNIMLDLVPPIWSILLGDKGFVERDVPIIPLFEQEISAAVLIDEDGDVIGTADSSGKILNDLNIKIGQVSKIDELMKGGIYPCSFQGKGIDVYKGNYALVANKNYPTCKHIKSLDTKGVKKTFTTLDGVEIRIREKASIQGVNMSELSLFVRMTPEGLMFNEDIKNIMEYLDNLDDDYDKEEKNKNDNVMLNKNQFGDYLKFVEQELEFQKSLEQLDVKVENARNTLKEEFSKFNYTPEEKFDLSNSKTYNEIVQIMNQEKDKRVEDVSKKLKNYKAKNDLLKEKIEQLNNTLAMLKLDSKEQVNLSDSMSVDSLQKELKRAQADKDAMKGYDKEVEKSYDEKTDGYMAPYCAVY